MVAFAAGCASNRPESSAAKAAAVGEDFLMGYPISVVSTFRETHRVDRQNNIYVVNQKAEGTIKYLTAEGRLSVRDSDQYNAGTLLENVLEERGYRVINSEEVPQYSEKIDDVYNVMVIVARPKNNDARALLFMAVLPFQSDPKVPNSIGQRAVWIALFDIEKEQYKEYPRYFIERAIEYYGRPSFRGRAYW